MVKIHRAFFRRFFTGASLFSFVATIITIAALSIVASSSYAQTQNSEPLLEEVLVTAERRETSLQDTPLSILAFSPDTIDQKNVDDISDLAMLAPNLEIKGGRGAGNNAPTFQIRGIAGGGGTTGERGVGLYIDGIYVPRTNGSVFRVLDVERVEVLRGPQGTLFGRNSTGGAIRIFSQQPHDEHEGYIKITGGNFNRRDVQATLNVPLSDTFFARGQLAFLNEDGYVKRGSQMLGGSEDLVARLQTRWEASSEVTASFGFLYSDSESDGNPQDIEEFDLRPGIEGVWEGNYADWVSDFLEADGQAPIAALNDPRFVLDDFTMPGLCFLDDTDPDWDTLCEQSNNSEYWQADANIEIALSDSLSMISTTGYAELDVSGVTNWQMIGTERRPNDVLSKVLYQEIQFNTALFDDKVDVVFGGTYFQEKASDSNFNTTRRGTSTPNPSRFAPANLDGSYGNANGDGDAGLFQLSINNTDQKSSSFGLFTNATWHITDQLNFTGGLRYAYDKKELAITEFASDDFTPAPGTDRTNVSTDHDWNEIDWRATIDYQITDDHMVYLTTSKAYRAGAFSFNIIDGVPGDQQSGDFIEPIPPEKVVNFETGLRSEWLGGRLRLNPTYYFMKWSNRQAARQVDCSSEGIATCPVGFRILVVDSGDVDVYGGEIDAQFAVTEHLTLDASLGIAKYDLKDPTANNGPYLFPAPSSESYNIGAHYWVPIDGNGTVTLNLNWSHISSQQTHPSEGTDSSYELPDYGLLGGQVRWISEDENISLTLYGNNLTDKTYATYATRFGGGYWDRGGPPIGDAAPLRSMLSATRGRPRNYGLTAQYNF